MAFTTTIAVFFGLLAAVEGSSGASVGSRAGLALGLAHTFQETHWADMDTDKHHNNTENNVLRRFQSHDNDIRSGVMGVVKRADISVPEADLLQLVEDVEDIRDRLFELLRTGRAPGSSSADGQDLPSGLPPTDDQNPSIDWPQADDLPHDGVPTAAESSPFIPPPPSEAPSAQDLTTLGPEVSPTSTPQLLTTALESFEPIEAEPTSSIGGVTDWTDDPLNDDNDDSDNTDNNDSTDDSNNTDDSDSNDGNKENDFEDDSKDDFGSEFTTVTATMTSDIDCTTTITHTFTEFFHEGPSTLATSLRVPSEFDDNGAFPTESVSVDGFPEDDNLVPFDFGEENETEPTTSPTTLEDLWEAAAPTVTEPPISDGTTDPLGDQTESEAVSEPSQESSATGQDGNVDGESPSVMTLKFPGPGSTSIVWRTIALPVAQSRRAW
ncbi:hypothetical protein ACRALDRAFT_1061836 [Sodiomyces alcalophilus JCM 7366]|uniref:uncharacterized protein n=1 Tax=Sodiomyces alcalophilus JCM 7366 TaxID=591952 RepID=UPI0039B53B5C